MINVIQPPLYLYRLRIRPFFVTRFPPVASLQVARLITEHKRHTPRLTRTEHGLSYYFFLKKNIEYGKCGRVWHDSAVTSSGPVVIVTELRPPNLCPEPERVLALHSVLGTTT